MVFGPLIANILIEVTKLNPSIMSKRRERIAIKDKRAFKKFATYLGVIVLILIIIIYFIFQNIS